jgi:hypothetical protein
MGSTPSSLDCPPRWATARSPELPTLAGRAARIADGLGQPLMAWQAAQLAPMLEHDHDGRMRYPVAVVIVPRRAGKS